MRANPFTFAAFAQTTIKSSLMRLKGDCLKTENGTLHVVSVGLRPSQKIGDYAHVEVFVLISIK